MFGDNCVDSDQIVFLYLPPRDAGIVFNLFRGAGPSDDGGHSRLLQGPAQGELSHRSTVLFSQLLELNHRVDILFETIRFEFGIGAAQIAFRKALIAGEFAAQQAAAEASIDQRGNSLSLAIRQQFLWPLPVQRG